MRDKIIVVDFEAPDVPMLASRLEELGVESIIKDCQVTAAEIRDLGHVKGIILSGGPKSVLKPDPLVLEPEIFKLGIPILGVCYGMELLMAHLGGRVERRKEPETGAFRLTVFRESPLFKNTPEEQTVYMNHSDQDMVMPKGFETLAHTKTCAIAAAQDRGRGFYGVQFHPEKSETVAGQQIFRNFLFDICGCQLPH